MSEPAKPAGPRVQVSAIGEAMLRLSVRPGDRIADAPALDVHVAGSEANVAYALSRVGVRAGWTSVLPANPLGRRVADTLAAGGVDISTVEWSAGGRLGTYFVELGSAPRPTSVVYDRAGSTMAMATPDMFDWPAVCDCRLLHLSGITMGISAGGREIAVRAVEEARRHDRLVCFDVNHRSRLWTAADAGRAALELAGMVDLVVCKAADARDLFGAGGRPADVANSLRGLLGARAAVITAGPDPVTGIDDGGTYSCPAHPVAAVDRIGAGDAFAAGIIWGWLEGSLELGMQRGAAMAALKMTLKGDLFRFDREAVQDLLEGGGDELIR